MFAKGSSGDLKDQEEMMDKLKKMLKSKDRQIEKQQSAIDNLTDALMKISTASYKLQSETVQTLDKKIKFLKDHSTTLYNEQ